MPSPEISTATASKQLLEITKELQQSMYAHLPEPNGPTTDELLAHCKNLCNICISILTIMQTDEKPHIEVVQSDAQLSGVQLTDAVGKMVKIDDMPNKDDFMELDLGDMDVNEH